MIERRTARVLVLAGLALLFTRCGGGTTADGTTAGPAPLADGGLRVDASSPSPDSSAPVPAPKKLTFPGVGSGGIFDPSLTRDPGTGKLWMSYSAVNASPTWPTQNAIAPHTRLAYSTDEGETWTDSGPVNRISDVTLPLAAPNNAGTWMNETSTLVYDPGAPGDQRWKLMWQTFLKVNGAPRFEHSWIAQKSAATPEGLSVAPEIKLFASYLYDTANNAATAATAPPVPTVPAIQIDTAFPALRTCIVAEPSLYANASALYLALQCEQLNDLVNEADNDRLITLLKCDSPCNTTSAASWKLLGRIFDRSTARAVEPSFNGGYAAPALVATASGVFLLVTPTVEPGSLYRGCRAFKFSDLDAASLEKNGAVPKAYLSLDGSTPDLFNGACAGIGGSASGVLRSELSAISGGEFQIFMTRATL